MGTRRHHFEVGLRRARPCAAHQSVRQGRAPGSVMLEYAQRSVIDAFPACSIRIDGQFNPRTKDRDDA